METLERLTKYPYPKHLISKYTLTDGTQIIIRPVRSEDIEIIQEFARNLSSELKHLNYMFTFKEFSTKMLESLIKIDYKKTMTLIGCMQKNNKEVVIGMVHYVTETDGKTAEFDMIVTDDWQNKGVGTQLTKSLIQAAKSNGIKTVKIIAMASNVGALSLAKRYGFAIISGDDPMVRIVTKDV